MLLLFVIYYTKYQEYNFLEYKLNIFISYISLSIEQYDQNLLNYIINANTEIL